MTLTNSQRKAMFARDKNIKQRLMTTESIADAERRGNVIVINEAEPHPISIHSKEGADLIEKVAKSHGDFSVNKKGNVLTLRKIK